MRINNTTRTLLWLLALSATLTIQSCSKKFLGFRYDPKAELSLEEIEFDYFSSRTKFKYKDGNKKNKATANIRIKRDSLIWFTLTNGVIEGVRGQITQDSLVLIDRLNKQVIRYSFDDLTKEFKFKFNYDLFQAVLIGDMPFEVSQEDVLEKQNNNYIVAQTNGDMTIRNKISSKTRRLENLKASTSLNKNTLELKYADFKLLDDKPFAFKALMTLTYFPEGKKEEATIDIEHNRARIETKPLRFPFNIPARYERK
ncbi:DUF4292 domain-containing protein [Roseivirga misakiensis]|uniref:DUF4292 domain-containing protein n=1 Tax=Roseivirga misakiensis TaxID=1563681 RepID=A0A1E5T280_9BACT|nr:DUF4292 domain-containing protein [Roseivirga misakiensis]OEK05470.1 hypothetical protein BFP71_18985 [Roseivirga misakiensis]